MVGRNPRRTKLNLCVTVQCAFFALCLPCSQLRGQDIDGILAASPVRVQSASPVANSGTTQFGSAVALDGDVLVVGAPNEDSSTVGTDLDTGAVYVFERFGFDWVQQQKLTAPTEIAQENFGASVGVALGDEGLDYLVVGAPGYDGARGRVYFFKRTDGGPWVFEVFHTQAVPEAGDRFGDGVAIDYFEPPASPTGDSVFVAVAGSPTNRGPLPGDSQNGSISIFQRSGGPPTWGRTHEFFGGMADLLGSSVAMAEHNIVAGVEGLDLAGFNTGGGQVFTQGNFDGTVYQYAAGKFLIPSDGVAGGNSLGTVAAVHNRPFVDENFAALGAPLADDGAPNAGKVYVYDLSTGAPGTSLIESAILYAPGTPASGNFGSAIALRGNLLVAGAPGPGIGGDGKVFFFERGASLEQWNSVGELAPPDLPPVGSCAGGSAVALQNDSAAVGCPTQSGLDNRAVFMYVSNAIFNDGFETGDTTRWSGRTGTCPPCTADIGCREVNGKNIFVVPMGVGQSGSDLCSAQGYQCAGVPVMAPPESACLAFHPGADVTFDVNGWKQAVWCNDDDGLACDGRIGCHHCPACTSTGLTCETDNSALLSELFVECTCSQ